MASLRTIVIFLLMADITYADIGLICTLREEREEILKIMRVEEIVTTTEREFYRGELYGTRIILVRSPMGKVNNGITAQLLVSNFNVEMIVSIGFGGAIEDSLKIGDVVFSTEALQHDTGSIKPYGFIWERSPEIGEADEINIQNFVASKGYRYGRIVSGDQFIASEDKREWLKKKLNASVVDMGAAGIYEVCKQNHIKCLFIRTISDRADIDARINYNAAVSNGNFRSIEAMIEFLKIANQFLR
jgi:adenosylhomocysteine nucleosidase